MVSIKTAAIAAILFAEASFMPLQGRVQPLEYAFLHSRNLISHDEKERIGELKERLKEDGFSQSSIDSLFEDKNFKLERDIAGKFKVNPESQFASGKIPYSKYRKILDLDGIITKAPAFFEKYKNDFEEAEKRYGVGKRYIAGILGVESRFKERKQIGGYKAFNALVSQYILTDRKKFAYREIKELIAFSETTGIPVFSFNSSYAGAIGHAQFIPSSLNMAFVGKRGKAGKPNPMDVVDCIYSIANYLSTAEIKPNSRNWKAIRAYNKSDAYIMAVIEISNSLK